MSDFSNHPGDGPVADRAAAIRDHIRNAIVDRRLGPGTKLSEHEVGALFDASRTVARAALQMLSFEGLVRTERNRGAFVANPTPEEAKQVFASRRLIEPGIAAQACARIEPADLLRFEEQLAAESQLSRLREDRRRAARRSRRRAIFICCWRPSSAIRSCFASWKSWWPARHWSSRSMAAPEFPPAGIPST